VAARLLVRVPSACTTIKIAAAGPLPVCVAVNTAGAVFLNGTLASSIAPEAVCTVTFPQPEERPAGITRFTCVEATEYSKASACVPARSVTVTLTPFNEICNGRDAEAELLAILGPKTDAIELGLNAVVT
jgi:hypothetical protein